MSDSKPLFKKNAKKKILRKRLEDDISSNSDDDNIHDKIEELKTLQKHRCKPKGIEITTLHIDEEVKNVTNPVANRTGIKIGGLVDIDKLKNAKDVDDAYDTSIGTQFSAETNKRDEDEEMMKYIEEQLLKRKKTFEENSNSLENGGKSNEFLTPEEAALQALPEHLRVSSAQHSEEMLSNQMLNGIPEVDLGIEVKIKNIEATEDAKLKLLRERQNKSSGPSVFVPTNMAVNFIQHSRFNIEDDSITKQEKEELIRKRKAAKKTGDKDSKATDDYHYERFKKQFRRY